jgi:hypothetical protein
LINYNLTFYLNIFFSRLSEIRRRRGQNSGWLHQTTDKTRYDIIDGIPSISEIRLNWHLSPFFICNLKNNSFVFRQSTYMCIAYIFIIITINIINSPWIFQLRHHFGLSCFPTGLYFNLSAFRKGGKEMTVDEDPELAPKYVLDHQDRMGYLVTNPFTNSTFSRIKFHRIENQVTPPN